jgi:hypothetical protein
MPRRWRRGDEIVIASIGLADYHAAITAKNYRRASPAGMAALR